MRHHRIGRSAAGPAAASRIVREARAVAEQAARASYGRLLAYLAVQSGDLAGAEDALCDALHRALETWPVRGVPDRPDAWLYTTARNHLQDARRHAAVRVRAAATMALLARATDDSARLEIPDERLRLMLICAHPAIDPSAHTPLMLQTVLGLDAGRIASAFLVTPAAMSQRLVRAKSKIRDARLRFELPGAADLPGRLDTVMEAVYAAYGSSWDDVAGADPRRRGLAEEAIWLARLLVALSRDEPEPQGLLALLLHCEARRHARRGSGGVYVPLPEQDAGLWSRPLIAEAERLLHQAAAAHHPGRFQLEAALQSLHVEAAATGRTNWPAAVALYEGLIRISPTAGARVGHAAAVAEVHGPEAGLALLGRIPAGTYQPWWALSAHLNARSGHQTAALAAYGTAVGLSEDPSVRAFLQARSATVRG